jgi:hypothetical protein
VLGFPIRKSSDLSSVDSSPRLIAASYVLHRLLVPRHPPYALKHLLTKMLASTVQFSNNTPTPDRTPRPSTSKTPRYQGNPGGSYFLPGKNACSFRTQQCVDISVADNHTRLPLIRRSCQRSTHELPPDYIRVRHGLCHNHIHQRGRSWRSAP